MESLVKTLTDFIISNWFFLIIIAILLLSLLRGGRKTTRIHSTGEFKDMVHSGTPVITEFFDDT